MSETLVKECADSRFECCGTSAVFQRRANSLRAKRNIITFLGLVAPLIVGATVLSFSVKSDAMLQVLLPIAGIVAVVQLVLSLWALVSGWDGKYDYAIDSIKANTYLENEFQRLATASENSLKRDLPKVREEYNRQSATDTAHGLAKKEKMYGYRSALQQYELMCPVCEKSGSALLPNKCHACGTLRWRIS